MLSDEEKKAFESVKDMFSDVTIKDIDEQSITIYGVAMLDVIKVLTIVEKQSKEIEELKEYKHDAELTKVACCTAQNCEALNNCIKLERELQNADKKWKDKIKAEIEPVLKQLERKMEEEYNKYGNSREYQDIVDAYNFLQSLLEKE